MSDETIMAETAQVQVQFLEHELELTETMIQHARYENDYSQTLRHIHEGLDTIRHFLPAVTSPEDHARITKGLERLEAEVAGLAGTATGAMPKNPAPPHR